MPLNVGVEVASTLRLRKKQVADMVTNHNPILNRMDKKGLIREYAGGGRTIFEPVMYGDNSSVQFFEGYETFTPPTVQDNIDGAEYPWRQLGGFLSISGREMAINSGKWQAVDLLETRIKHLDANLKNRFAASLYGNGTAFGGKEFGGLQLLVADNPAAAGTVGGIDQAANAFWRNKFSAAAVFNTANAKSRMNTLYLQTQRNNEQIDLIVTDQEMYAQYEAGEQQLQRYASPDTANAGFPTLKYKNADIVYDSNCPTRHMYFLNTDSLSFRYAGSRWFEVGDARQVTNADYEVIPIWVMGNLTTNDRARHGVLLSTGIA